MSLDDEARAKVAVGVKLAVEDDGGVLGLVEHRLVPAGAQVDDREAPHPDSETALGEHALVVRPPVSDAVGHGPDLLPAHGPTVEADDADDAAHAQAALATTSR